MTVAASKVPAPAFASRDEHGVECVRFCPLRGLRTEQRLVGARAENPCPDTHDTHHEHGTAYYASDKVTESCMGLLISIVCPKQPTGPSIQKRSETPAYSSTSGVIRLSPKFAPASSCMSLLI